NVPAGKYARAALRFYGMHDDLKPRFVGQKDVRAVLRAVATSECDAGFVYATDARADKSVRTLFAFEQKSYPFVVYPAALCAGSINKEAARAFLQYLLGKESQAAFAARGFSPGEAP
ncbi:partial Molybdate-binding protein ModA, partial [Gammaproteobacteria bacterium]